MPLEAPEQFFETATHQDKTIMVGDQIIVHHNGDRRIVTVAVLSSAKIISGGL